MRVRNVRAHRDARSRKFRWHVVRLAEARQDRQLLGVVASREGGCEVACSTLAEFALLKYKRVGSVPVECRSFQKAWWEVN